MPRKTRLGHRRYRHGAPNAARRRNDVERGVRMARQSGPKAGDKARTSGAWWARRSASRWRADQRLQFPAVPAQRRHAAGMGTVRPAHAAHVEERDRSPSARRGARPGSRRPPWATRPDCTAPPICPGSRSELIRRATSARNRSMSAEARIRLDREAGVLDQRRQVHGEIQGRLLIRSVRCVVGRMRQPAAGGGQVVPLSAAYLGIEHTHQRRRDVLTRRDRQAPACPRRTASRDRARLRSRRPSSGACFPGEPRSAAIARSVTPMWVSCLSAEIVQVDDLGTGGAQDLPQVLDHRRFVGVLHLRCS